MRDMTLDSVQEESGAGAPAVSPRYRIQAIERAVAILNAFSVDDPELGVTELAERVGLHKSTVHRFMVNLDAAGLVERNPRTGRYRLGLHIFELGGLVMQQMNLWDEALPFLESLVRDTGETGHLAVLDGGEAIYIERVEARRALRVPSAIGRGYPAHATNLGKVLLADLPRERVAEIVAERGLAAYTPKTITDLPALEAELESIRERGYAIDDEEYDEGLRCIGAGVRDHSGHVVGARHRRAGHPDHPRPRGGAGAARDGRGQRALAPPRRPPVRGLRPGDAPCPQHGLPSAGAPARLAVSGCRPPPGSRAPARKSPTPYVQGELP
jgi:DNA-binding IclR family transcriptional regulator